MKEINCTNTQIYIYLCSSYQAFRAVWKFHSTIIDETHLALEMRNHHNYREETESSEKSLQLSMKYIWHLKIVRHHLIIDRGKTDADIEMSHFARKDKKLCTNVITGPIPSD